MTVMFLCTGNYYRSRFAEELFNSIAMQSNSAHRAISRGLALERLMPGVGAISHYAVQALKTHGVVLKEPVRGPLPATNKDFQVVSSVIALDWDEHRVLVEDRFPDWAHAVEYWHIADIDRVHPDKALPELNNQVRSLLVRLG